MEYGFLRETEEIALKSGRDESFNLCRTGLDTYLKTIFPNTNDWLHDKALGKVNNIIYRIRPDYRSESLKLVVEFDGLPHYNNPDIIIKDFKNSKIYQSLGYKVVRIPYFIQLTKENVKQLFNVDIKEDLFPSNIPSLYSNCTPSYLCILGIIRMAAEFKQYNKAYFDLNINHMKEKEPYTSGWHILEKVFNNKNINIQLFYSDDFLNNKEDIYQLI